MSHNVDQKEAGKFLNVRLSLNSSVTRVTRLRKFLSRSPQERVLLRNETLLRLLLEGHAAQQDGI